MPLSIKTNVSSLDAQRNLAQTENASQSAMSKLSSGFRITRASDDAAGLGISTNLQAQIKSYSQAVRNARDGMSLVQTADSALDQTANILTRLRELSMQSASSGVSNTERGYIQAEADALTDEINRIAQSTEFNGTKLLSGSGPSLTFQIGIRNDISGGTHSGTDTVSVTAQDASLVTGLGFADVAGGATHALDLTTQDAASAALDTVDAAIESVSSIRSTLGAAANRLTSVVATAQQASQSLSAANSQIRDVDVAQESANMSQAQILMQAGVSVLSQANQMPQVALKLLG